LRATATTPGHLPRRCRCVPPQPSPPGGITVPRTSQQCVWVKRARAWKSTCKLCLAAVGFPNPCRTQTEITSIHVLTTRTQRASCTWRHYLQLISKHVWVVTQCATGRGWQAVPGGAAAQAAGGGGARQIPNAIANDLILRHICLSQDAVGKLYLAALLRKQPAVAEGVITSVNGGAWFDVYVPRYGVEGRLLTADMACCASWNSSAKCGLVTLWGSLAPPGTSV